ncbi:hypothetical protein WR25_17748 [Diploscapter pachys]|uniref:Uncharacterized protein n=1 Tax=Diploscapter pachys TaxID=2018661 RepID=A0A2A2LQ05_9BILA|nr:hypothetical protein WR25_17748 [Diploscapter pachys]
MDRTNALKKTNMSTQRSMQSTPLIQNAGRFVRSFLGAETGREVSELSILPLCAQQQHAQSHSHVSIQMKSKERRGMKNGEREGVEVDRGSGLKQSSREALKLKMEGDVKMRPSAPPPYRNTSIRSSSGSVSTPTVHPHPLDSPYAVTPPTQLNFNPSVNLYRQTSRQSAAASTPKGHGHYGKR